MSIPLQITFRHMAAREAVAAEVQARVDALEHVHARLTSCRVLVEAPAGRQHHGGQFRVRIDLALPAGRLVVGRSPHDRPGHEDVSMAIGDAFRAARRRLEDRVRRRRQPIPLGGAEPAATETS